MKFLFIVTLIINSNISSEDLAARKKKEKHIPYYLIPGLGQIKNKKFFKSIVLITAELAVISQWSLNSSIYQDYESNPDKYALRKNRYLEKRNKYAWWIGIIYFYSMLDYIVDKHLINFNDAMDDSIENPVKIKKEKIDEK